MCFPPQLPLCSDGGASLLEVRGGHVGDDGRLCRPGGRPSALARPPRLREGPQTDRVHLGTAESFILRRDYFNQKWSLKTDPDSALGLKTDWDGSESCRKNGLPVEGREKTSSDVKSEPFELLFPFPHR